MQLSRIALLANRIRVWYPPDRNAWPALFAEGQNFGMSPGIHSERQVVPGNAPSAPNRLVLRTAHGSSECQSVGTDLSRQTFDVLSGRCFFVREFHLDFLQARSVLGWKRFLDETLLLRLQQIQLRVKPGKLIELFLDVDHDIVPLAECSGADAPHPANRRYFFPCGQGNYTEDHSPRKTDACVRVKRIIAFRVEGRAHSTNPARSKIDGIPI